MKTFFYRQLWLLALIAVVAGNTPLLAQSTAAAPYCQPINNFQACGFQIGIGAVQFGPLTNTTGCAEAPGYTYYNTLPPSVFNAGQTYTYRVDPLSGMTVSYTNQCRAWIDYNRNNIFEDPAEAVWAGQPQVGPNGVFPVVTGNFTIPGNAVPGVTRLRVRTMNSGVMNPCNTINYGETEDYDIIIGGASIVNSFPTPAPDPMNILRVNNLYNGSTTQFPKPSLTVERPTTAGFTQILTYRIEAVSAGLLPAGTIVYEMLDPVTNSTTITNLPAFPPNPSVFTATKARGTAAPPTGSTPGAPGVIYDGTFNTNTIPPGIYRIVATHDLRQGTTSITLQNWVHEFIVAADRDLSATQIISPLDNTRARYLRTQSIPIIAQFRNVGLETVTRYRAYAEIYDGATLVQSIETIRSTDQGGGIPAGGMPTNAIDEIILGEFFTVDVKNYSLKVCCELMETVENPSGAIDQQAFNNCLPRSNQPEHLFSVWYLIDFETQQILNPKPSGNVVGRPFFVNAVFANNGLSADGVPAFATITGPPNNTVYVNRQQILMDVPNGFQNSLIGIFNEFTPPVVGTYTVEIEILAAGDEYSPNDKKTITITVEDALRGVYTIGTRKPGPRNFTTIDDAVNVLYARGVSGPVRFQFTDDNYSVGVLPAPDPFNPKPALDLSSRIIGASATNTITFEADPALTGLTRAGATIRLNSQNGIGVFFGQNRFPANNNAVMNEFPFKENANSYGYITFDGGAQKSLRFRLRTYANRRAVFYLGGRTFNHTIKNCIIENDPSTPETDFRTELPGVTIQSNAFVFSPDSSGSGSSFRTFSAGIFQRNTPPSDAQGTNRAGMDTVIVENNVIYRGNKENAFIGNEIRGFGYGIASIGIGSLKERSRIVRYYNTGTKIQNNLISRIRRSGIFLGYEEGAVVSGNKIFDVGIQATGLGGEAIGIEVGGQRNPIFHIGFNNIDVDVSNNEINAVVSNTFATGVKVEQVQNDLSSVVPPPGAYLQPSVAERIRVVSNMIWGIGRSTGSGASRAGIHYTTDRNTALSGVNRLLTARIGNYFTRQDRISNNTIWFDADGVTNSGAVVGIGLQHVRGAEVKNNAIVMLSPSTTADLGGGFPHTGLFYQGVHPKYSGFFSSDRNAFWTPSAAMMRMVEIDSISQILVAGYQDEYQTISQWRAWTGQDLNSMWGRNFTGDYSITGSFPLQYLRIRKNPEPTGSVLSNRGERLSYLTADIDGQSRGSVGQPFDIGADEFQGVSYVNDVELTTILSPREYRSGSSQVSYADAEHIMTRDSVPVWVRARNNGSMSQVVVIVGEFAVENSASSGNSVGSYPGLSQFGSRTIEIAAGESKDVYLGYIRPVALKQQPAGYTTPVWMRDAVSASMLDHVTPRYRLQARITTVDENISNNSETMEARFYLQKSLLRMMTSWEGKSYCHTCTTAVGDPNQARLTIARLNADSLHRGLNALGFYGGMDNKGGITYDVLDRDGWEPRAVDYSWYRTLLWSNDNGLLSRNEREDIRDYIAVGNLSSKKNLILSSQELVKGHIGLNAVNDEFFPRYILRSQRGRTVSGAVASTPSASGYAMPPIASPNQSTVVGMSLQKNISELVRRTGFSYGTFTDPLPSPALMRVYVDGFTQGLARPAFKYSYRDAGIADSAMGIATTGEQANTIYLGTDWRHFGVVGARSGVERVLRGSVDFFDNNDGNVLPVQLVSFDAVGSGRNVNVVWSTASESQSGWFEVERRRSDESSYTSVGVVDAAGSSSSRLDYNLVDRGLSNGLYEYRLKMVDIDGTSSHSGSVEVEIGLASDGLRLSSVQPSPVQGVSIVSYRVGSSGSVRLVLVDMMGREASVLSEGDRRSGQEYTAEIDGSLLPSGMYQVVLESGGLRTVLPVQIVR